MFYSGSNNHFKKITGKNQYKKLLDSRTSLKNALYMFYICSHICLQRFVHI